MRSFDTSNLFSDLGQVIECDAELVPLNYGALLAAMTSGYVEKHCV